MNGVRRFEAVPFSIVYAGLKPDHQATSAPLIPDTAGQIANGYQMRRPRDGGPPVGYAIVDSSGSVRYRTLDPTVWKHLKEVQTIWNATP